MHGDSDNACRRFGLLNPLAVASFGAVTESPAGGHFASDLGRLRQVARDAYAEGRTADASDAQAAVFAVAATDGWEQVDDFLFAGLAHHAGGRAQDGIAIVRAGVGRFPGNASLYENLAVLLLVEGDLAGSIDASLRALALGSASPNVQDCLCEAYWRAGRTNLAVVAGRSALEAKDRRFGGSAPTVAMPAGPPPVFCPERPEQNVISYTLWGDQPRYLVPLLENARIKPHLFPEWSIRVHHDVLVDASYLDQLAVAGVQLCPMELPPGVPAHRQLLWRFEAIADPSVARFLIRDADALLTVKERVAVDAWLASDFHFHAMRDWFSHTDLLMAGMWGGVGGILPSPATLLRAYTHWRMEHRHIDQDLLSETVWPAIRHDVLVHDSVFQPCLGSVAFPPFGALPAGHHIGQNAFDHFSKVG